MADLVESGKPSLGSAWSEFLKAQLNGSAVVVHYATDFSDLWGESFLGDIGAPEAAKPLIIVWDGMPQVALRTDSQLMNHLTPLDWALAFGTWCVEPGNDRVTRVSSIHIIDLTGPAYSDIHVMRIRATLLDNMPWVKLYAPLIPDGAAYRRSYAPLEELAGSGPDGMAMYLNHNPEMRSVVLGREGVVRVALGHLASFWTATLGQSGDHHDLNNIVGPQIIEEMIGAGEGIRKNASMFMDTFMTRLKWTGFLPRPNERVSYEPIEFADPVDIVALDDQLERGWDRVLGRLVGMSNEVTFRDPGPDLAELATQGKTRIYGATKPYGMLGALGIQSGEGSTTVDSGLYSARRYDSLVPSGDGARPWILVLDLRLFSGEVREERKWYRMLAEAAKQIHEQSKSNLAWSGFEESEELEYLIGDGALDDVHVDTAISLLPRLCALRWPSVPIIVFSVTGRRGLTASLAEYGNIFLSSAKPNILAGDPRDRLEAFVQGWRQDIQHAVGLLSAQEHILKLMSRRIAAVKYLGDRHKLDTNHHIVVALDETGVSGRPAAAIGGICLISKGDDPDAARANAVVFMEKLRQHGVNYYDRAPWYFDNPEPKSGQDVESNDISKGQDVSGVLRSAVEDDTNIALGCFRYWLSPVSEQQESVPGDTFSDERYLRGLSNLMEIFAAEYVPSAGLDWGKTTVSVWFPSKQSPEFSSVEEARQHAEKFDFRYELGRRNLETIGGFGSAYSVLLRALGERPSCFEHVLRGIQGIKTRTIPNTFTKSDGYQSSLHWYCAKCKDYLFPKKIRERGNSATCVRDGSERIPDYSVMQHLADETVGVGEFANGYKSSLSPDYCFDIEEGPKISEFLQSARLADLGFEKDSFMLAYKHEFFPRESISVNNGFSGDIFDTRLILNLSRYSERVDGNTLMEMAGGRVRIGKPHIQRERPESIATGGNRSGGVVKYYDEQKGFGFIKAEDGREVFFHKSELVGAEVHVSIKRKTKVSMEIVEGAKGLQAKGVRLA